MTTEPEVVDLVETRVRAVPGVADLHTGAFGEVATYLPGRRVEGIQIREHETSVHVVLVYGAPILITADAIREAVEPLVDNPVKVSVEDVVDRKL